MDAERIDVLVVRTPTYRFLIDSTGIVEQKQQSRLIMNLLILLILLIIKFNYANGQAEDDKDLILTGPLVPTSGQYCTRT